MGATGEHQERSEVLLRPVRTERVYEQIAAQIREKIISGELDAGTRIPSEERLAAEAGVSRSTIRESLRVLEEGGFLGRESPRVLVVRGHSDDAAHGELEDELLTQKVTFNDLFEALFLIEPELTRLAALRATDADLEKLGANLEAQRQHAADLEEWNRLDEEFHFTVACAADNGTLLMARMPVAQILVPTLRESTRSSAMTAAAIAFHERIFAELSRRDAAAAFEAEQLHLEDWRIGWSKMGFNFSQEIGSLS